MENINAEIVNKDIIRDVFDPSLGLKLVEGGGVIVVPEGTTAHEFAYKVHTEIGDKFVKAVSLVTQKAIGKEHPVKHLDVVEILTN